MSRPTPHQIIPFTKQIELLEEEIKNKSVRITVLSEKLDLVNDLLNEIGCDIIHGLGTELLIKNRLADEKQIIINTITDIITKAKGIPQFIKEDIVKLNVSGGNGKDEHRG